MSESQAGHLLEIRQFEHYRWMNIAGNLIQSLMDINDPQEILLPNTAAMLASLLFCQQPSSLLNLGMGGGAFERYFLDRFPLINFTTVETSQSVIAASQRYFSIPSGVAIQHCSAEEYLRTSTSSHDIILCDIFEQESHPSCLFQEVFYTQAKRSLTEQGVLAINLSPANEAELIELLLPLRLSFPSIMLLAVPGCSNIIVFATQTKAPNSAELIQRACKLMETKSLDLTELAPQIQELPSKI